MKASTQPKGVSDVWIRRELVEHATLINLMADGRLAGTHRTATAAPTVGDNAQGDFVRNSTPTELGVATSKYVVLGFICVSGGNPGTWVEARVLTGN